MARFDLNLLSALDTLLSERNVTRAADRLHVTQPTMSGMLQRLRYQFDDQLLVRSGRAMELTPFAASLVTPVHEALSGIKALMHAEPTFNPATSTRTFTIMASDYCTSIFLSLAIERLAEAGPGMRLDIRALSSPVEQILSGEIDLCLATDERSLLCKDDAADKLQSEFLFLDEFVCIVARDHPLDESSELDDFLGFPSVGVQLAGIPSTIDAVAIRQVAPRHKPTYIVPEFSLVPRIVSRTRATGLVQARLADHYVRTLPIKILRPPFPISPLRETMLWHPRHLEDPAHIWLRSLLLKVSYALRSETSSPIFGATLTPAAFCAG